MIETPISFATPIDSFFQDGFAQSAFTMAIVLLMILVLNYLCNIIIKTYFEEHVSTLRKIKKFILWIIFISSLLGQIKSLSNIIKAILASGGVIAVMLGLASQEAASSLLSGMLIKIFKPYKIGDFIHVKNYDVTGFVKEMNLRHTIIETNEETQIIIPNTSMNVSVIENINDSKQKINFLYLDVAYDTDLEEAIKIIKQEVVKHPLTMQDDCIVYVTEFKDSSIQLRATVIAATHQSGFDALSDLRKSIKQRFDDADIEIPYQHVVIMNK